MGTTSRTRRLTYGGPCNPQIACVLFRCAPEIHNNIYELVFTSDHDLNASNVELALAKPPPKDLLVTCKSIRNEAGKLYTQAYQDMWTGTHSSVTKPASIDHITSQISEHVWHEDINRIQHPEIVSYAPLLQVKTLFAVELELPMSVAGLWQLKDRSAREAARAGTRTVAGTYKRAAMVLERAVDRSSTFLRKDCFFKSLGPEVKAKRHLFALLKIYYFAGQWRKLGSED